jgi:GNAT superfamily N-acetyltransferase
MADSVEIVSVGANNVAEYGFFCFKSKPKSEGYRRKLEWLGQRFAEGLTITILLENGRSVGFIETMPGERAWRAVEAPGYMVIHCLWVVGRGKGKGYGSRLLEACVEDARRKQQRGVVMVSSSGTWLAGSKLFLKRGFEAVGGVPPSFDLLVKRFGQSSLPTFPSDWSERSQHHGSGMTIIRSDQCPYIDDAVAGALKIAADMEVEARVVELNDCRQVQDLAPSPYGVFSVVYDGQLLSYRYMGNREKKQLVAFLGR